MEYIRRTKKFIRGTKGSFSERLLSWKEIFPKDIRDKLLLMSNNSGKGSEKGLALRWVQSYLASYRGDRINKILYSDVKDSLPGDMLTKVDWMSMKNSLEVRVPFLDHRVVELAFKIRGPLKLYKGKTKYLLKETFKDILPPSLYGRPKAGFEIPIDRWLKTDLRFLIVEYLGEKRIKEQCVFRYEIIENLIQNLLANRTDTSWMLWNLIVFQYWYERYLT
jgi:asparagine synthase (glutamine-hydrolysing)